MTGTQASHQSLLPNMEARLSYLEQQVRELTGQVEELTHALHEARAAHATGETPSVLDEEDALEPGENEPKVEKAEVATKDVSQTQLFPKSDGVLPEGPVQVAYDHATSLLNRQDYGRAQLAFKEITKRFPDDPLVINAYFWLGESYFKQNKFTDASVAFGEAYQAYRKQIKDSESTGEEGSGAISHTKAAQSLLKLSLSLKAMGQPKDACAALGELFKKFPHMRSNVHRMAEQTHAKLNCPGTVGLSKTAQPKIDAPNDLKSPAPQGS